MYAYCGVQDPATDSVQPMKIPELIDVSAVVIAVPPKASDSELPAVAAVPAALNVPVPTHVDAEAADDTARKTSRNVSDHATLERLIGTVCATDGPRETPAVVKPNRGVIVSVPDAPVDMMPPASSS